MGIISVKQEQALPGLGDRVAWLSDSTASPPIDAKDRIPNAEYRLVDNTTVIATSKDDLTKGSVAFPINRDENNSLASETSHSPPDASVWTGTNANGTAASSDCSGWTSGALGATGQFNDSGAAWSHGSSDGCPIYL